MLNERVRCTSIVDFDCADLDSEFIPFHWQDPSDDKKEREIADIVISSKGWSKFVIRICICTFMFAFFVPLPIFICPTKRYTHPQTLAILNKKKCQILNWRQYYCILQIAHCLNFMHKNAYHCHK